MHGRGLERVWGYARPRSALVPENSCTHDSHNYKYPHSAAMLRSILCEETFWHFWISHLGQLLNFFKLLFSRLQCRLVGSLILLPMAGRLDRPKGCVRHAANSNSDAFFRTNLKVTMELVMGQCRQFHECIAQCIGNIIQQASRMQRGYSRWGSVATSTKQTFASKIFRRRIS